MIHSYRYSNSFPTNRWALAGSRLAGISSALRGRSGQPGTPAPVFAGLLAGVVAVCSPTAGAVDGKSYPGAACQPGELNDPTDIQYTWLGHAKNVLAGNSLGVICPIVRESMSSVSGISSASVRINKTNNTGFLCELRSRNSHSTAGFVQTQWNFDGAGNRTINFNGPANGYASGYYVLSCYIPSGHQLLSYRVDEN